MKKILLGFLISTLFIQFCYAQCEINQNCNENTKKNCEKCEITDDEYCIYNQCYFDKHYKKMKKDLCLTRRQETCVDKIYKNFKADMECLCAKYAKEKNKLLDMIECEDDCLKDQVKIVKEIKKETKEKYKDYKEDVKEQLCKNQLSDFRKFQREEKRKIKKIIKYGKVYKFPCTNCCK